MINNIEELHKKLEQLISDGYGKKPIFIDDGNDNYMIDSVQKNTNMDIEPDYYILMADERVEHNWRQFWGVDDV